MGQPIFVTGGTGYIGRRLIERLAAGGQRVLGLVRAASAGRLPAGAEPVIGDALDATTFAPAVPRGAVFVQLVGTPHPSPSKARQFREIDLVSARASVEAAAAAGVSHFVYVSVAQPAPVMRAYIAVRAEAEALIRASDLHATILRPWYVLGPGHRWPFALLPLYALARMVPRLRDGADRLRPVTLTAMLDALESAITGPAPPDARVIDVDGIRRLHAHARTQAGAANEAAGSPARARVSAG